MTSSETPTDDDEAALPAAVARDREPDREPGRAAPALDRDQLTRLAVIGVAIAAGWGFILWTHNLRFSAPVLFLWLGWFAVVAGVHYLWRTGTATADVSDEDAAWWRPTGAREELEREKRSLLKAIKEVEFDHHTGKMSEKDAQAMTRVYRARAIEVIKALDELAAGGKRSARQQIEREVKARLAVEGPSKKAEAAAERKKAGKGKGGRKPEARPAKEPAASKPEAKETPAKVEAKSGTEAKAEAKAKPEAETEAGAGAETEAGAEAETEAEAGTGAGAEAGAGTETDTERAAAADQPPVKDEPKPVESSEAT